MSSDPCSTFSSFASSLRSPSSPSSSTQSLPPWRFPGPSSTFHKAEKARPAHERNQSAYTPRGPVLSTEKRAHRRAAHGSVSSVPSPPPSEYSRSPLSRFPSYSTAAHRASAMANPATPAKHVRRTSSLNDSPFSDYFSDDARSAICNTSAPDEIKQLLLRMNRLQSLIMRDQCRDAIALVGRKLTEIELELNTMHSETRLDIEDSAVFMDQGYAQNVSAPSSPSRKSASRAPPIKPIPESQECLECGGAVLDRSALVSADHFRAERDYLNLRMQELVEGLGSAQSELSNRYHEVREMNESHNAAIEEREEKIEKLRSENESLRSDLGFEYSELLFLKLQMKSMEVDVDDIVEPNVSDAITVDDVRATRARIEKKNKILSEMDRWRADWQDVNSRFKRRRTKYGEPLASPLVEPESGEVEWQLETVKEGGRGRVTSLTITRLDNTPGIDAILLADADATAQAVDESTTDMPSPSTSPSAPVAVAGEVGLPVTEVPDMARLEPATEQADDCSVITACSDDDREEFHDSEDKDLEVEDEVEDENEEQQDEEEEDDEEEEEEEELAPSQHEAVQTTPQVSAWRELWASLASLSGLPDDDDQEDSYEE